MPDLFNRPSTADTGTRNAHDYYETPAWMTASLLAHHPIPRHSLVLEPCCGDGSIVRALETAGFRSIITNDLDERHPASRHKDATDPAFWEMKTLAPVDWVITNPPFGVAFPMLEQAVLLAREGVAFLLRKTFDEPTQARGPWLSIHPPTHTIRLPRHSFRGKGSDSVATDWFIWRVGTKAALWDVAAPYIVDHRAKERTL